MTDEITLTLPHERPFYGVANLVLGGLAVRLDLTFEQLQDLLLAVGGVLDRHQEGDWVTLAVRVEPDTLHTRIGPFSGDAMRTELERDPGDELSLRRLLDAVVDDVELRKQNGDHWVELTKSLRRAD